MCPSPVHFSAPCLCISQPLNGVRDCTHFTCHVRRVEECAGRNADKIVNRKLVQVYTPGTVLDGPMLVRAPAFLPVCAHSALGGVEKVIYVPAAIPNQCKRVLLPTH